MSANLLAVAVGIKQKDLVDKMVMKVLGPGSLLITFLIHSAIVIVILIF